MNPSQAQGPPSSRVSAMALDSSPSVQLAAMALNSSRLMQALRDAGPTSAPGRASSSYTSLFGGTSTRRTPRLTESPSPTPTLSNTPSSLNRRVSGNSNYSSSRTTSNNVQSGETSGNFRYLVREPSLPYEAWEIVSTTPGQINGA